MASLEFDEIYSRFFVKVKAYEFAQLTDREIEEFMCNWLHSAVSNPYVRKLLSSCSIDDDDETITYTLKNSVDEEADKEFLISVLTLGLVIEWLNPKVLTTTNMVQTYGTTEMKFYSEANHLAGVKQAQRDCIIEQRRMISDRGYVWNTYLGSV